MTDRPIIFSAPMVRALLAGRKTMTRRVIKPQPFEHPGMNCRRLTFFNKRGDERGDASPDGPYGGAYMFADYHIGDRLWVREAHYLTDDGHNEYAVCAVDENDVREHLAKIDRLPLNFPESTKALHRKLRPSIHMPRWASRLTLIVEGVKVERLQDISEDDAEKEGCRGCLGPNPDFPDEWDPSPAEEFRDLWNSINGPESWAANPWVAAIRFRVIKANIDTVEHEAA
jgi:hypothetical protein